MTNVVSLNFQQLHNLTYLEWIIVQQFKLCNRVYIQIELVAQKLVPVKVDPFSNQFQPQAPVLTWESRAVRLKLDLNFR